MKSILLLFVLYVALSYAGYNLKDDWRGTNFLSNFNYFTGADPTHGYVYYASQQQSTDWGYTYVSNNQVFIRSDSTSVSSGSGRGSVRLESKKRYTHGLFIIDLEHMPIGMGTWPAFWMTQGVNWPSGGEIDIIEGVNENTFNTMSLHTSANCKVPTTRTAEFGYPGNGDCYNQPGCSITDNDNTNSYGRGFNNIGGGVYATQWESSGIYIWFFPRNNIPANIKSNTPDPATWGNPRARFAFNQGCDDASHFFNQVIIFDNTFCGDWAGNVYPGGIGACNNYVQNNPGAFSEAYWKINYVQVYQL